MCLLTGCDGGDPEAWLTCAPAILRGIKKQTTSDPELPAPLADTASQLFRACFGFTLRLLADTLQAFDPQPEALDRWDAERGDAATSPWAQVRFARFLLTFTSLVCSRVC